MLHPRQNRIDYGAQLIPPAPGYELSYAVGTTYSLDLDALILLPVALFYSQQLDGNPDELRFDMLEALTRASERIHIFYQRGQLKVPRKYHPLIAYWEKGIHEVSMPSYVSSFHPKTWIIRYDHPEEGAIYRLLVTSRNMTFDRSWDIAYSATGVVSDQYRPENESLTDMLKYLGDVGKNNFPKGFVDDLMYVYFEFPDGIRSAMFHPLGVEDSSGKPYPNPVFRKKWDELAIVSPFLDEQTLQLATRSCHSKPWLFSSKEALDGISLQTLHKFDCWQFSTFIEQAEFLQSLEEQGLEPKAQNLHAKLYVGKSGANCKWFLGSANCTSPAQDRNIEALIALDGREGIAFRPRTVFRQLTQPDKAEEWAPFQRYDPSQRIENADVLQRQQLLRKLRYDLSRMKVRGDAHLMPGSVHYRLEIAIDAVKLTIPDGCKVTYKPLAEHQKTSTPLFAGESNFCEHYENYPETMLSPYLIWTIEIDGLISQFLLPMEISLPETRLGRIVTAIIDSHDKFMNYIAFLLTGEEGGTINPGSGDGNKYKNISLLFEGAAVFEKLMIAASRNPDKLDAVDRLVEQIQKEEDAGKAIITPEFESLWEIFKTYRKMVS